MEIRDQVVVVTGAAQGIGEALARCFKKEGAGALVLADRSEQVMTVAEDIGGLGQVTDVTKPEQVAALVATAEQKYGRIDLMCSNAGIFRLDGRAAEDQWMATGGSAEDWQASWEVNVLAHVHAARAALPGMLARKRGYFLHTASAAGLLSQIGSATYSVTKHAAIGFAESLAIAHGDQGIGVSVLCPQGVRTPMLGSGGDSSAAARDGVLEPEVVATCAVEGLREERFLILPHPEVLTYFQRKSADYDRWLRGMRRLRTLVREG